MMKMMKLLPAASSTGAMPSGPPLLALPGDALLPPIACPPSVRATGMHCRLLPQMAMSDYWMTLLLLA